MTADAASSCISRDVWVYNDDLSVCVSHINTLRRSGLIYRQTVRT